MMLADSMYLENIHEYVEDLNTIVRYAHSMLTVALSSL